MNADNADQRSSAESAAKLIDRTHAPIYYPLPLTKPRRIPGDNVMNRRNYLALMGAAAGAVATSRLDLVSAQEPKSADPGAPTTSTIEDRKRRMKWWHEAKFGMFIHWGLYSTLGRHEWVMENEGIPAQEYEPLADKFKPKPNAARDWARLAKHTGMKYMVMTTKHHEGFWDVGGRVAKGGGGIRGVGRERGREEVGG